MNPLARRDDGARLMLVTDRRAAGDRPLAEVVRAALAGGVDAVQIREKDLPGGALLSLAREIVEAAGSARGRPVVLVNDRLDVALAAHAAGVHLPSDGLPVAAARARTGKKFLIGRSVHSAAEARQAEKEGVDYVIFGPVFATPSKASYGEPLGPAALKKAVESVRIPVYAIGGVQAGNVAELRGIRIAGVAAITALVAAADPAQAAAELRALLAR
jgi:thiamine-phosphate pyrophosphorylase